MTTLQAAAQRDGAPLLLQPLDLLDELAELVADIRDKFTEAKGVGFDVKALRKIVSLRKKSKTEREEEESILDVYLHALGMIEDERRAEHAAKLSAVGGEAVQ